MKLELKNISYSSRLSEETSCYSARLYADGIYIADVANRGCGGPDEVRPVDRMGATITTLAAAEAYCKTLPPLVASDMTLPMDLELWCGQALDDWLTRRDFTKAIASKILMLEDGKLMESRFKGISKILPKHVAHIAAKYPRATILNALPFDEALAIYKGKAS